MPGSFAIFHFPTHKFCSWGFSTVFSTASLESIASLQISEDLLEHFGLSNLQPSQLHVTAIYGTLHENTMYHMYIDVCMMKVALREGYFI